MGASLGTGKEAGNEIGEMALSEEVGIRDLEMAGLEVIGHHNLLCFFGRDWECDTGVV